QFEHPVDVSFAALGFEDMDAEGGRLLVRYPAPDIDLDKLLKSNSPIALRRDGERRVATRLIWNARPRSLRIAKTGIAPAGLPALVGGFDIFSLDFDQVA